LQAFDAELRRRCQACRPNCLAKPSSKTSQEWPLGPPRVALAMIISGRKRAIVVLTNEAGDWQPFFRIWLVASLAMPRSDAQDWIADSYRHGAGPRPSTSAPRSQGYVKQSTPCAAGGMAESRRKIPLDFAQPQRPPSRYAASGPNANPFARADASISLRPAVAPCALRNGMARGQLVIPLQISMGICTASRPIRPERVPSVFLAGGRKRGNFAVVAWNPHHRAEPRGPILIFCERLGNQVQAYTSRRATPVIAPWMLAPAARRRGRAGPAFPNANIRPGRRQRHQARRTRTQASTQRARAARRR